MHMFIALLVAGFASAQPRPGRTATADLALGRKVYLARCAACHGEDGRGSPAFARESNAYSPDALDLTSERLLQQDDAALARGIQSGHGRMKGFGPKLSGQELTAVVAYIRSLGQARAGSDSGLRQVRAGAGRRLRPPAK